MSKREQAVIFLKYILEGLCMHPEKLIIEDSIDERGLVLRVKAHDEDMRYLIGRGGKIADSLRDVLHIWGTRHIASVKVFIGEQRDESNSTV